MSALAANYGLPLDRETRIADLSAGERQRVEIIRVLMQEPKLIVMDEPTSVLTPQEADQLFVVLRQLVAEGRSVLYISHKLDEVQRLCNSATILRHGRVVARCLPSEHSKAALAQMMVGEAVAQVAASNFDPSDAAPALTAQDVTLPAQSAFGVALDQISFSVFPGQIAGIAGNGQSELFDVLSGELALTASDDANRLSVYDVGIEHLGIAARRKLGMAFVCEERLGHGAAPDFALTENVTLSRGRSDDTLVHRGFVFSAVARSIKDRVCDVFDVRKGSKNPPARALSGGNLQKFVVGREMDWNPKIIIINQPSWGVDAGAASHLRQALVDHARAGAACVVISQDLDEIFEIADTIAVISRGRLSPMVPKNDTTREEIGLLMANVGSALHDNTVESRDVA